MANYLKLILPQLTLLYVSTHMMTYTVGWRCKRPVPYFFLCGIQIATPSWSLLLSIIHNLHVSLLFCIDCDHLDLFIPFRFITFFTSLRYISRRAMEWCRWWVVVSLFDFRRAWVWTEVLWISRWFMLVSKDVMIRHWDSER